MPDVYQGVDLETTSRKEQKRNENNTKPTHLLYTQHLQGTVPGAVRTEATSGWK